MVTDTIRAIAIDRPRPTAGGHENTVAIPAAGRFVAQTATQPGMAPSQEAIAVYEAVRNVNEYVHNVQRNLQFSVDEASGNTIIKVIDAETDEVVRQIPSQELLALASHLQQMRDAETSGLLVESSA